MNNTEHYVNNQHLLAGLEEAECIVYKSIVERLFVERLFDGRIVEVTLHKVHKILH